jgi:hypothetical protein
MARPDDHRVIKLPAPEVSRFGRCLACLGLLFLLSALMGVCLADTFPSPKTIDSQQDRIWLDGHLSFLRDPTGEMTFEQVREAAENARFQTANPGACRPAIWRENPSGCN